MCPVCKAEAPEYVEETYLDAQLYRVTAVGPHGILALCKGTYRIVSKEPIKEEP